MSRSAPILAAILVCCVAADGTRAAERPVVDCTDLACWQERKSSECSHGAATIQTCLVFLQSLETARRSRQTSDLALLLGETLGGLARDTDLPPAVQTRYRERARAAFAEVVRREPLRAAGYLGLARVLESAYSFGATDGDKWRYAASAWHSYGEAAERYPSATSDRSAESVLVRLKEDIDYSLLQRALREPEPHLAYLADALTTVCEKSIVAIVGFDECTNGLESAVATAERSAALGVRRAVAEAALAGMRTVAGEALPASPLTQRRFQGWLDRLVMAGLEPVDTEVDVLEARADYTANLLDRAAVLLSAIELLPNRGDIRLKLGATYVGIRAWSEALDQLRVARFFMPAEDQPRIDRLLAAADRSYQARFEPPPVAE